jgi:hypothetical protein
VRIITEMLWICEGLQDYGRTNDSRGLEALDYRRKGPGQTRFLTPGLGENCTCIEKNMVKPSGSVVG